MILPVSFGNHFSSSSTSSAHELGERGWSEEYFAFLISKPAATDARMALMFPTTEPKNLRVSDDRLLLAEISPFPTW